MARFLESRLPCRLALAMAPLAVAGCVLLPPLDPNQQFLLAKADAVTPIVQVIDDRSPQERAARSRSDGWQVGESSMTPDVGSFLAQELTRTIQSSPDRARLESLLAGKTVHLRRFAVGAQRSQGAGARLLESPGDGPRQRQAMTELDAFVYALDAPGHFQVEIAVDVGDGHFSGAFPGSMHVAPFEGALVEPLHYAVLQLVVQIGNAGATPPS